MTTIETIKIGMRRLPPGLRNACEGGHVSAWVGRLLLYPRQVDAEAIAEALGLGWKPMALSHKGWDGQSLELWSDDVVVTVFAPSKEAE